MINLAITGQDTLAAAAWECCRHHHKIVVPKFADIVWSCYDTPIGADDAPDSDWVIDRISEDVSNTNESALTLVSSQLPVGSTQVLESRFPNRRFAHSPENIRVKTAIEDFRNQARIVVGVRTHDDDEMLRQLLSPLTANIIFTTPETAEMVKHALNCWLGMNIAFINEIAKICRVVDAEVNTITEAMRLDQRLSPKTPIKAGPPFGGGHLARDIHTMTMIAKENSISIPIISHIKESNET